MQYFSATQCKDSIKTLCYLWVWDDWLSLGGGKYAFKFGGFDLCEALNQINVQYELTRVKLWMLLYIGSMVLTHSW